MTSTVHFSVNGYEPHRRGALNEVYGRVLLKQEIGPLPGFALRFDANFRVFPELGLVSARCSGLSMPAVPPSTLPATTACRTICCSRYASRAAASFGKRATKRWLARVKQ